MDRLIRSLQKWWFHLISGKSELERICENRMHDHLMAVRVARSLRLSRQLAAEAEGLFGNGGLPQLSGIHSSVRSIHRRICTVKRIGPPEAAEENAGLLASEIGSEITRDNLKLSLEMLFFVRVLKERAASRRALTMDRTVAEHEAALEGLWSGLKPGLRRRGGKITEEWGEIGFQGKDPATGTTASQRATASLFFPTYLSVPSLPPSCCAAPSYSLHHLSHQSL